MLRYKTETRPGLVALYDIQTGNRAGQFLQPRSPYGVCIAKSIKPEELCFLGIVQSQQDVSVLADPTHKVFHVYVKVETGYFLRLRMSIQQHLNVQEQITEV